MTQLTRIGQIKISMNENDHEPPHVHFRHPEFHVMIAIHTGEIIRGEVRPMRRIKDAMN